MWAVGREAVDELGSPADPTCFIEFDLKFHAFVFPLETFQDIRSGLVCLDEGQPTKAELCGCQRKFYFISQSDRRRKENERTYGKKYMFHSDLPTAQSAFSIIGLSRMCKQRYAGWVYDLYTKLTQVLQRHIWLKI